MFDEIEHNCRNCRNDVEDCQYTRFTFASSARVSYFAKPVDTSGKQENAYVTVRPPRFIYRSIPFRSSAARYCAANNAPEYAYIRTGITECYYNRVEFCCVYYSGSLFRLNATSDANM